MIFNSTKKSLLLFSVIFGLLIKSSPLCAQKYIKVDMFCLLLETKDKATQEGNLAYYGYQKKNVDDINRFFFDKYDNMIYINDQGRSSGYSIGHCDDETWNFFRKSLKESTYDGYSYKDKKQEEYFIYYSRNGHYAISFARPKDGKFLMTFIDNTDKMKSLVYADGAEHGVEAKYLTINSYTNATRLRVKSGQRVSIKYVAGNIKFGAVAGSGGPDGIKGFTSYNYVPGFPHGALLGKIGDSDWFLVGSQKSFISTMTGVLQLTINDGSPNDNEGSYIVECTVTD